MHEFLVSVFVFQTSSIDVHLVFELKCWPTSCFWMICVLYLPPPENQQISEGKLIMPTIEKIRGISSLKQLGACCCYPPGTSHEQWKRSWWFTTKVYRRLYYPVIWGWSIINKPWNTDPLLNNQCFMESKAGFFWWLTWRLLGKSPFWNRRFMAGQPTPTLTYPSKEIRTS